MDAGWDPFYHSFKNINKTLIGCSSVANHQSVGRG